LYAFLISFVQATLSAISASLPLLAYKPCSSMKVNQRFGETYRFHLQVRRISPARNQHESRWLEGGEI
jgi:hypothetical protein